MSPSIILPRGVDPPGLEPAPPARDIFDHSPHRNRGMASIPAERSTPEWDNRLIATAVALGCPRWAAEQARYHGPARASLLQVYAHVQLAAAGDGEAQEKVDYYRWCFQEARKQEMIADIPEQGGQHLKQPEN